MRKHFWSRPIVGALKYAHYRVNCPVPTSGGSAREVSFRVFRANISLG